MRLIFMGTPYLAAYVLSRLAASRHEIAAVVTQPDKAGGRGMKVRISPVKEVAMEQEIPVLQPASLKDATIQEEIRNLEPELLVVTAFSQLLPESLLQMAPYGCINIHPSLLPKYRGAAPLVGPILNGDAESGVTIMKMIRQLDAGDILLQKAFLLDPKENVRTLTAKAAELGAEMLLETLDQIENGTVTATPQNDAESTYIGQLEKEDGRIRFEKDASSIEHQIRACAPWPSAFTTLAGKTFKIWDADVVAFPTSQEQAAPGTVVYADKKKLLVACGTDCLKLNEVQMEGKKRMTMEEFLRGRKIEQGFQFG